MAAALALVALGLPGMALGETAGPSFARITGHFILPAGPETGGLSGLEFSADGRRCVALSDSATLTQGTVTRDAEGTITAVTIAGPPMALTDAAGAPLVDPYDDSEGLALGGDGGLFASFELHHRVQEFTAEGHVLRQLPVPREFTAFGENSGLEALALAPDGALYALPEGPASGAATIPVFRFRNGQWDRPFTLPGDGTWRPVGADFSADGGLYLLERDFWPLVGFMSRLRRIGFDDGGVTEDEVLLTTAAGQFGNLEGLSIWQDGSGGTHATLVSDNNFLPFLPAEFVDVLIGNGLDPAAGED